MKRQRFFYSFLISYILILTIPIIAFVVSYVSFNNSYIDEVLNRYQDNLNNIYSNLTSQIQTLDNISILVNSDNDFSDYRIVNSPGAAFLNIEKKIKSYIYSNDFADDILFYSESYGFLYGLNTSLIDRYFSETLYNTNFTKQDYLELFSNLSKTTWLPISEITINGLQHTLATYIIPIEKDSSKNRFKSLLLFYISKESFNEIFESLFIDEFSKISVNANGTNIYSNDMNWDNKVKNSSHIKNIIEHDNYLTMTIDGTDYFVLNNKYKYMNNDLSVDLYLSAESIMNANNRIFYISLISLLSTILLGFLTIIISLKYNYNPIKKLSEYAKNIYSNSNNNSNELNNAKFALDKLLSVNTNITKLNSQYEKERIILKLVNNVLGDKELLISECSNAQININHNYFTCVVIDSPFDKQKFYDFADKRPAISDVEFAYYNNLILIIGSEYDNIDEVQNVINVVSKFLDNSDNFIGIGDFVNDITQLSSSYCQSLIALNKCKQEGVTQFFFGKIMGLNELNTKYSRNDVKDLHESIINADIKQFKRRMEFYKRNLVSFAENKYMYIYIAHDIVNTCIHALEASKITSDKLFYRYTYLLHNNSYPHFENIIKLINELTQDVVCILEKSPLKNNYQRAVLDLEEIQKYIEIHFRSPNLSVQKIADEFDTSISNLSHFYKYKTNNTISSYINVLRMEEAKVLLAGTDFTICEIVEKIGFLYSSNFIRNFKKFEGCTPSKFREISRLNNDSV